MDGRGLHQHRHRVSSGVVRNMFTVASEAFPSRAVGSVVGFGGMCGGMLMLLVAGGMLQWLGNFTPLLIFASVRQPLAWIAIRALVGTRTGISWSCFPATRSIRNSDEQREYTCQACADVTARLHHRFTPRPYAC